MDDDPDWGDMEVRAAELAQLRDDIQRARRFDSRLLDRLEMHLSQYRHWWYDNLPSYLPVGYIIEQREAYRVGLREAALAVAKALDGLD